MPPLRFRTFRTFLVALTLLSGFARTIDLRAATIAVTISTSGDAPLSASLQVLVPIGPRIITNAATITRGAPQRTPGSNGNALVGSPADVSGIVFEDVNYGGGAGRDRVTALAAGGSIRPNARVELFNSSGDLVAHTTTDVTGAYVFPGTLPGIYTVRVVNSTVSSARSGYVAASHLAVQTFRTEASSGSANAVTDRVGGEQPNKVDAGNGTTTLAALSTTTTVAQSVTSVNVSGNHVTGLDFGFSFGVICNTNHEGQGSLRQFIHHANLLSNTGLAIQGRTAGIEHAIFMISNGTTTPGLRATNDFFSGGVATITPLFFMSHIVSPLVLDAQTQPGWSGVPILELNGNGGNASGLRFTGAAAGSALRGFIINRFSHTGVEVENDDVTVQGCYIGTDATGTLARGNGGAGIEASAVDNLLIGGTTATARNVISANGWDGILCSGCTNSNISGNRIGVNVSGTAALGNAQQGIGFFGNASTTNITGNVIGGNLQNGILCDPSTGTMSGLTMSGNLIGTGADGMTAIGNGVDGIALLNTQNVVIGTNGDGLNDAAERNVISGNTSDGIQLSNSSGTVIAGNLIGTNATGSAFLANGARGIHVEANNTTIGGNTATRANRIVGNNGHGVSVVSGSGNSIKRNSIHDNAGLGIELNNDGPDVNDAGDADGGANAKQNHPVLTGCISTGGNTNITGTLNSTANTTYRIEFFSSPGADPSGRGEGEVFIGTMDVTTNASGDAMINALLAGATITSGHTVAAIATNSTTNNTSEFSNTVITTAGGGLSGTVFEDVNYGGGAGRDRATALAAGGTDRAGARVELYDAWNNFVTSTTTNASGTYGFNGLLPANYTVRVVNTSVSSARNGYATGTHRAVQTFRTDASSGSAVIRTDRVGGEIPNKADAANGSTTLTDLNSAGTTAQSITAVTLGSSDITGLDFGYSFNVVCNTNDAGQGSLRQFIIHANALSNTGLAIQGRTVNIDHAVFMIGNGTAAPGLRAAVNHFISGVAPIAPLSAYPAITEAVMIDGRTQPGWSGSPLLDITGAGAGSTSSGFHITSAGSTIRGFIIRRFSWYGVRIEGASASNNLVEACWIGTSISGNAASANSGSGVFMAQGNANTVQGNVISGNYPGLGISSSASNTVVQGNIIGSNVAGTAPLMNKDGVYITATSGGVVGTNGDGANDANERNIISGNNGTGVVVTNSTAVIVAGNMIGTDATGTIDLGNADHGIFMNTVQNTRIGTNADGISDALERNVISGNNGYGMGLVGTPSSGNVVAGNHIGTNADGTAALGNGQRGILLNVTEGYLIGTNGDGVNDATEGNLISGNTQQGIELFSDVSQITIAGNRIGTDVTGALAMPNAIGIALNGTCGNNTIGGVNPGTSNRIAFNTAQGISTSATAGSGNRILGNAISGNGALGIDLATNGVTPNDVGDTDSGPNGSQNFPLLNTAVLSGGNTTISGTLNSTANTTFRVEFFSSPAADPTGFGEGANYLGSNVVTTDGIGNASVYTVLAGVAVSSGHVISSTATNTSNNSTSEFSGVIAATLPPIAICQDNTVSLNSAGTVTVSTAAVDNGSNDPDGAIASMSVSPNTFNCANIGANSVTLTVTDNSGATATCTATVTVVDNIAPTIVGCPTNITLNAGASCNAVATWATPTASDNCGGGTLTSTHTSGSVFPVGSTTVSYTATDAAGRTATCSFVVVVNDVTNPAITCPANIVVGTSLGLCGAVVNYVPPVGTDNCSGATTVRIAGPASGSTFPLGLTTITHRVTDAAGRQATCSFTVTVNDTEAPNAICRTVDIGLNGSGVANLTPAQVNNGSIDNCTITGMSVVPNSFTVTGTHTVTLTVTDAAGNTDACTVDITVSDNNAPTAVCRNATIHVNAAGQASVTGAMLDDGSMDNGTIVSLTPSQTLFDCSDLGPNNITLAVTDDSGNSDVCTAVVNVLDTIAPQAACHPLIVQLDASGHVTITGADIDNGSSDNCSVTSITLDRSSFDCSDLGSNTVVLTVTDGSGNSSTCTATVTVEDTIAPTIHCPSDIVMDNDAGICGAVVNYSLPSISDNCSNPVLTCTSGPASGSAFPVGITSVTYQVTDAAGHQASCSFTVTVNDTEAPSAVCQSLDIGLDDLGVATLTPQQVDAGSTDNCAIDSMVVSPSSFTTTGTYDVTLTVFDANGNSDACTVSITVTDGLAPTAICNDTILHLDAAGHATITPHDIDGGSHDNGTIVDLSASQTAFDCGDLGVNTVLLTVTDDNGNTDQCTALVTVLDTIAPTAVCQDITVQLDANGNVTITGIDIDGGSTDNCGTGALAYAADITSFQSTGTFEVTLTVTDASGNTSTCIASVTVTSNEPPLAICRNDTVYLDADGIASIVAADIDDGSTAHGPFTLSASPMLFGCDGIGNNPVILTVTDGNGATDQCTAIVTVIDTIAPVAVCRNITIALDGNGQATIVAAELDGGSSDNCGISSMEVSIAEFDSAGTFQVQLTLTDASGNASTCLATVIVEPPSIHGPLVIPFGFSPNGDGIADTWTIRGVDPGASVQVEIFNRWGDTVHADADYRNDWDGTCTRGVGPTGALPDGTYFFVVTITDERPVTGYLQIAR